MAKLIVKKHSRLRPIHYAIFFGVVFSVIGWYFYDNPQLQSLRMQLTQAHDINKLSIANYELEERNTDLDKQILKMERLANLDNDTSIRLQNEIKSLQEQVFNLRRELIFYQGIITGSSYSTGLNIQGLHIETTRKKNFFKYKLVLTNIDKSDKVSEVTVSMSVEGSDKSGFRSLPMKDFVSGIERNRKIKVAGFERLEGNFDLPDGFEPLRVLVDLKQHDGEKLRLRRAFEWYTGES